MIPPLRFGIKNPPVLYHFTTGSAWRQIQEDEFIRPAPALDTEEKGVFAVEPQNFFSHWFDPDTYDVLKLWSWIRNKVFNSPQDDETLVCLAIDVPPEAPLYYREPFSWETLFLEHNAKDLPYGQMASEGWEFILREPVPLARVRKIAEFHHEDLDHGVEDPRDMELAAFRQALVELLPESRAH